MIRPKSSLPPPREKIPSPSFTRWSFYAVFVLAALGQICLASPSVPVAWGFLFFAIASFLFIRETRKPFPKKPSPRFLRRERFLLIATGLIALAFRLANLSRVPPGLYIDASTFGLAALNIGPTWPLPQSLMEINGWPVLAAYPLKAFFLLFGADRFALLLFAVFVSLAAFPFYYFVFRRWSGFEVTLAALFFISALRWHVTATRLGLLPIHVLLAMFATLAFLQWGLATGRKRHFLIAGIWVSYGFYTYQAFKLFPLFLLIYATRESLERKKGAKLPGIGLFSRR